MPDVKLTLPEAFAHASRAFQVGNYREAEAICQRILAAKNDFFDAVQLLALAQSKLGRGNDALATFERALALQPDSADVFCNRGVTLREMKRFDEALASYEQAIALRPNYAEAFNNRGNVLRDLKRFDDALASYERALAIQPDYIAALDNYGSTLLELGRYDEALASYDRLLAKMPENLSALNNRGSIFRMQQRYDEALESYDRALAIAPDFAEAHHNRASTLLELKRYDEALASYGRAIALRPGFAQAHHNRGKVLYFLKRYEEALENYDRALAIETDNADTHFNRASSLLELRRFKEAIASFDAVLSIRPDHINALNNRAFAQKSLKRFDDALASYERAAVIKPDFAEAHWNEALVRLLLGDFVRGWTKYEWRWKNEALDLPKLNYTTPLWLGMESLTGKTILIHGEQGVGDMIQMCRYVPLLADRGARVIVAVDPPMRALLASLRGLTKIVSAGDAMPAHDFHCPMLSLPLAFGTQLATIPSTTPYLSVTPQSKKIWEMRIGPKDRPRIGLVWSGSPEHKNDRNRSISLRALLPLLERDATFFSLQKDARSDDLSVLRQCNDILDFSAQFTDFAETAALISHLDLVILVDTSIAHLAGALGKPAWILLPFVPDWRWLLDREDSPWYPTAKLFRQDETRSWDGVVERIGAALDVFVKNSKILTAAPPRYVPR